MVILRFLFGCVANFFRRLLFVWWAIITRDDFEGRFYTFATAFSPRNTLKERVKEERDYRTWKRRANMEVIR